MKNHLLLPSKDSLAPILAIAVVLAIVLPPPCANAEHEGRIQIYSEVSRETAAREEGEIATVCVGGCLRVFYSQNHVAGTIFNCNDRPPL